MKVESGNLYANVAAQLAGEDFLELAAAGKVRIERIVSTGQSTTAGEWLDQARAEWVILLQGAAALRFEGDDKPHTMQVGDYVKIAAHCRHRVEWTSREPPAVWLAVHYEAPENIEI